MWCFRWSDNTTFPTYLLTRIRNDQGGMALVTVLGVILVLMAIAVGIVTQVRPQLRVVRFEQDIVQLKLLVQSGMNEAVQKAKNDLEGFIGSAPDPTQPTPQGWQPCTPSPIDSQRPLGPAYCLDVVQLKPIQFREHGLPQEVLQIPFAIRWRLRDGDQVGVSYGWLNIGDSGDVKPYYMHRWCSAPDLQRVEPCIQGGG